MVNYLLSIYVPRNIRRRIGFAHETDRLEIVVVADVLLVDLYEWLVLGQFHHLQVCGPNFRMETGRIF